LSGDADHFVTPYLPHVRLDEALGLVREMTSKEKQALWVACDTFAAWIDKLHAGKMTHGDAQQSQFLLTPNLEPLAWIDWESMQPIVHEFQLMDDYVGLMCAAGKLRQEGAAQPGKLLTKLESWPCGGLPHDLVDL
jgi:hypothetical protein